MGSSVSSVFHSEGYVRISCKSGFLVTIFGNEETNIGATKCGLDCTGTESYRTSEIEIFHSKHTAFLDSWKIQSQYRQRSNLRMFEIRRILKAPATTYFRMPFQTHFQEVENFNFQITVVIPVAILKMLENWGPILGYQYTDIDIPVYAIGCFNRIVNFFLLHREAAKNQGSCQNAVQMEAAEAKCPGTGDYHSFPAASGLGSQDDHSQKSSKSLITRLLSGFFRV